ncbi:MAG TPA: ABC transporter permease subunit [Acidimicrobiales bacterium]|nr:ABC transporter permease subunit [Acidimicrobiales bacterium]
MPRTHRRRALSTGFRIGTYLALLLVLGPALWILGGVVVRAVPHWQWSVLWTTTSGTSGGLKGAILGTLILMAGVLVIAGTIGVLAGIHLAELARPRRNGKAGGGLLRTAADVLSGFPSIVLGYVGYVALVVGLHWGYSLLPALLILSIMVVPYIAKATETALRQVPTAYREGAEALGMSTGYSLRKVVLKSALPGIVTGLLIALAIAGGETAPLLYTAGWNGRVWTGALVHGHGFTYLTYPVFTFYDTASQNAHYLAYDAALLLMVIVLLLLVASRIIVARTQRHAESRQG